MEAMSKIKEVQDIRRNSVYTKFIDQLDNPNIGYCISRMFGSFEFDMKSWYQLTFALLLKEDKIFHVGDIKLYPTLSPTDVKTCFVLGIRVLFVNEYAIKELRSLQFSMFQD
jgi:hypothetical protein